MSVPIDVMLIRKLGKHSSEIRGTERKQVALGDWASAIFIPVITLYYLRTNFKNSDSEKCFIHTFWTNKKENCDAQ